MEYEKRDRNSWPATQFDPLADNWPAGCVARKENGKWVYFYSDCLEEGGPLIAGDWFIGKGRGQLSNEEFEQDFVASS